MLAVSKFCVLVSFFGVTLWLPLIVKSMGRMTDLEVGLASAIPYFVAAVLGIMIGKHSDKTGERIKHITIPTLLGSVGFVITALAGQGQPVLALLGLTMATAGLWVANSIFWVLPSAILTGSSAALGIALINTIGNFGGFFGPVLTGWIKGATDTYFWALITLGAILAVSAMITVTMGRKVPSLRGRSFENAEPAKA